MGQVGSRLNLDALHSARGRSQQEETLYAYSLSKNCFSNFFLMGGERFEVNDPVYLFGDNCDLSFLSCAKPYVLPYEQAQKNLLTSLNNKQKAINKVTNRVSRLSSPLNILINRHGNRVTTRKHDAQTQTSATSNHGKGSEPSQPLVMLINIRKETLRLVKQQNSDEETTNRVYNIEFSFDAEVDCSIRIFYFCTRELVSTGVTYKSQDASCTSKFYTYKKGLNQKFEQPEHVFRPYLYDEDLLIYKPLDQEGNSNQAAVFPIVIHCVALDGPIPRQSQSLVATIEKSQLDESYSIKPLKQLIFADGIQYILQDIYGIENGQLLARTKCKSKIKGQKSGDIQQASANSKHSSSSKLKFKSRSLQSNLNYTPVNTLSDTASLASADFSSSNFDRQNNRGSIANSTRGPLGAENSFDCVICMSDERDTMLLPCRHLCLCSSCAQSLRFQANSCPICRCPFKAALNLRLIDRNKNSVSSTVQSGGQQTVKSATNDAEKHRQQPNQQSAQASHLSEHCC